MEKKIILVYPSEAVGMIADLGNGEPTQNGDRTSQYFPIAKGFGAKIGDTVKASLIEEKRGLYSSDWGYALHIINDVDGTDCQLFRTDHLDAIELIALLGEILKKLEGGAL